MDVSSRFLEIVREVMDAERLIKRGTLLIDSGAKSEHFSSFDCRKSLILLGHNKNIELLGELAEVLAGINQTALAQQYRTLHENESTPAAEAARRHMFAEELVAKCEAHQKVMNQLCSRIAELVSVSDRLKALLKEQQ